jgi:hypothetical protein
MLPLLYRYGENIVLRHLGGTKRRAGGSRWQEPAALWSG